MSFRFSTTPLLITERGGASRLGDHVQANSPVMLITDKGLYGLGLVDEAIKSLTSVCSHLEVFTEVEPDPSATTVLKAAEVAKTHQVRQVIGFGGGSSMDVAKVVAALAYPDNTQTLEDIYGVDKFSGTRLPLIQVPTTAGTGSEVTPVAVVTTGNTTKAGIVSERLLPDIAVLDATLTLGLPGHITAATGIDAMVHAIEAYTSKHRKNPISDMLAKKALELLGPNVLKCINDGGDLEAREKMLLGANLAGQAFANAPVAAVHALAYPLGGHFHLPHGLSNALVLPHVMRFNLPASSVLYAELAEVLLPDLPQAETQDVRAEYLISWLADITSASGLATTLTETGIKDSDLTLLASEAMKQQRLLINNPRDVSFDDALAIYKAAL